VAAQESHPHSAAPAVVLTPQPLSTYIPPPVAVVPATIEQPTVARSETPSPVPAAPAPIATSEGVTPVVHRRREGVVTPVLPAWPGTPATAHGWRWYGWGAATPVGGPGMNPHPQGPATSVPTAPPEKLKADAPKTEPPKTDAPKPETPKPAPMVAVPQLPGVDPKPDGNWLPAPPAAISPATSDQPLPVAAPPAVDMSPSAPKPAPAPPIVPTASDPWSSVTPPGAKAPGTSAARASAHR
jgi:hypothetical protein